MERLQNDQIKPNAFDAHIIDIDQKIKVLSIEDERDEFLLLKEILKSHPLIELSNAAVCSMVRSKMSKLLISQRFALLIIL
jgi:hypothetical protein